jgi:CrcB protein
VSDLAIILRKLLLLFMAGGLGTLARFGMQRWAQDLSGSLYPWGTTAVNMVGCLAFGFCWSYFETRASWTGEGRFVVLVGFMGAFTTFSTFIFETNQLLRDEQWLFAFGNIAIQNFVGLAALFVGLALGRYV